MRLNLSGILRLRHTMPLALLLAAFAWAPTPSHGAVISGELPFDSANGTPFTMFGGLSVTSGTALQFQITYDEFAIDTNPGDPNIGEYNAITEVVLTIGGSSVTLDSTSPLSAFDPSQSRISVLSTPDRLTIDVRAEANLVTFGQDALIISLRGPSSLFTSDALNPIGGTTTLDLADFTGLNDARLDATTIIPFVQQDAFYSVDTGTITFPNSTPQPPVTTAEPASLGLLAAGLAAVGGLGWLRRRRQRVS